MKTESGQGHGQIVRQVLIALIAAAGVASVADAQERERTSPSAEAQAPVLAELLREQIAEQRARVDELRQHYTEHHPSMIVVMRQLEQLEARLEDEEVETDVDEAAEDADELENG